jgi:hypothetical protein
MRCRDEREGQPFEAWERTVSQLTIAHTELEKLKGVSDELLLLGEEVHDVLTRVRQQNIPRSTSA